MNVMKKYWETVYLGLLFLAPVACFCAGAWYTFCKFRGSYQEIPWKIFFCFDASHILYMLGAVALWLFKKTKNLDTERFFRMIKVYVAVILLIQYAFITFLFPDNFTWGCTFLFLIFLLFAFDFKYMLFNLSCYFLLAFAGHIMFHEQYFSGERAFESAFFRIIIFFLYGIMSGVISFFVEKFLRQMQEWEDENAFLTERQFKYYQNLDLMDKELRKFRHDIKNHFLCMQELTERGELLELKNYFYDLAGDFFQGEKIYFSGNVVIDSILNYHIYHMCGKYVKPVVYGRLPEIVSVSAMDLCTIFSNMLSNAVKGANLLERENELVIRFQGGEKYFSICVTNEIPVEGQGEKTGEKANDRDDRQNDRNHGYGLKKIKETVRKYDGEFEQARDGETATFTLQIYLPV